MEGLMNVLMSLELHTVLLALFIIVLLFLIVNSQDSKAEPPGPWALPLVGNLLQLDTKELYLSFMKLSKKYGSVFKVYLGPKKVVVLTGYQTVKEALITNQEVFGERDVPAIFQEFSNEHGITCGNGDSWREMRRFSLVNLKDFGMGKTASEQKISEECQFLVEAWKAHKGKAFDPKQSLSYAVSNIICSMVYGARFEYTDPEFTSLVDKTLHRLDLAVSGQAQLYNVLPLVRRWMPIRKEIEELSVSIKKQNLTFFARLKNTLNPCTSRGLVDAFLLQKQKLEESGNNRYFHEDNLLMTVINLFGGGTDTVTTTLWWGLLYLAKYLQVQDRMREELGNLVGHNQVQLADRKNLHFINAVIHEVQRLTAIAPSGLPHKVSADIIFDGFFLKKGTSVLPVMYSVLRDETQWEKPNSFNPAHFLDAEGKFMKHPAFMAFSAGARVCIGESLARMELFFFFCTILQNFRITPPPGVSVEDMNLHVHGKTSIIPPHYELCAVPIM